MASPSERDCDQVGDRQVVVPALLHGGGNGTAGQPERPSGQEGVRQGDLAEAVGYLAADGEGEVEPRPRGPGGAGRRTAVVSQ